MSRPRRVPRVAEGTARRTRGAGTQSASRRHGHLLQLACRRAPACVCRGWCGRFEGDSKSAPNVEGATSPKNKQLSLLPRARNRSSTPAGHPRPPQRAASAPVLLIARALHRPVRPRPSPPAARAVRRRFLHVAPPHHTPTPTPCRRSGPWAACWRACSSPPCLCCLRMRRTGAWSGEGWGLTAREIGGCWGDGMCGARACLAAAARVPPARPCARTPRRSRRQGA